MAKATAAAEDVPTAAPAAEDTGKGAEGDNLTGLPVPESAQPPPEAKPAHRAPRLLLPAPPGRAADLSPDHQGELSLRFRADWLPTFPALARSWERSCVLR